MNEDAHLPDRLSMEIFGQMRSKYNSQAPGRKLPEGGELSSGESQASEQFHGAILRLRFSYVGSASSTWESQQNLKRLAHEELVPKTKAKHSSNES